MFETAPENVFPRRVFTEDGEAQLNDHILGLYDAVAAEIGLTPP